MKFFQEIVAIFIKESRNSLTLREGGLNFQEDSIAYISKSQMHQFLIEASTTDVLCVTDNLKKHYLVISK